MSASPTVFVVDDDRSFLKAVARLLRGSGHAVETFGSARDLLQRLRQEASGCILADLKMPGMDGMELHEAVAVSENPLPVVFLSGRGDVPTTVRALKQGAEDFLTKTAPKTELLDAVTRAMARDVAERRARAQLRAARSTFDRLTAREREVLAHVVQGRANKEIAWDLSIHERTVKLHRTSITAKLGVSSVAELTRWAQEAGLLPELDQTAGRTLPKGQ
ncbi:MAG TPA: response regulator [Candidatus Polarisedimenticolia bacterium]|nr:response regulator [Candidatus Polarisedimenticolia bacterium]